ncbi:MAG: SDR family oxidoreductase [Deltaproteobacteria bacterium]|nr:SDR family oxidoreductase [Deltaproteobacteria bacterium]
MKVLRGRRGLVTGAAAGIGRSIALALAKEGVDLALLDLDRDGLEHVAEEVGQLGVEAVTFVADVADPEQVSGCLASLRADPRGLHILINNAGVLHFDRLERTTLEDWDRVLDVNLRAPIRLVHELLPLLRAQDEAHIVNVGSLAGLVARRRLAAYGTSKSGLIGLSLGLRAELGPAIGVSVVCPGVIDTGLVDAARDTGHTRRRRPPARLAGSPERVAARTLTAIRRDRALVIVTAHARALWWLQRLSPYILDAHQQWRNRRRQRR